MFSICKANLLNSHLCGSLVALMVFASWPQRRNRGWKFYFHIKHVWRRLLFHWRDANKKRIMLEVNTEYLKNSYFDCAKISSVAKSWAPNCTWCYLPFPFYSAGLKNASQKAPKSVKSRIHLSSFSFSYKLHSNWIRAFCCGSERCDESELNYWSLGNSQRQDQV